MHVEVFSAKDEMWRGSKGPSPGKTRTAGCEKPIMALVRELADGKAEIKLHGSCASASGRYAPQFNKTFSVYLTMENLQQLLSFAASKGLLKLNAKVVQPKRAKRGT